MRHASLLRFSASVLLAASALAAHADTFNFAFTGLDNGSGTFTANATANPGEYLVSGVSGTFNKLTINGLLKPGSYPVLSPPANDNLLFLPQNNGGYLDFSGVAFTVGTNNRSIDLYYDSSAGYFAIKGVNENSDGLNSFTLTRVAAAPEPSSLALLGTGVLSAVGVLRRRFAR